MTAPSLQARFETAEPFAASPSAEPVKITASPFRWPDHRTLPRRPWVWGRWLLRSTVSAIVAPGGVGKSSFVASMLLSLASGRQEMLGKTVWDGPKRVWYWNLEDSLDELEMQLVAASMFHRVGQDACGDRIFLDSGPEGSELRIAIEDRDGFQIAVPVVEALVAELIERKIDVLVVDPFVSSHGVSENDNGAIDAVVKTWTSVAKRANCSIVLVHHTKKLGGEKVTAEASRGAVALIAAARVTLVLNRMDKEEAQKFGISEDRERRRLFTVQDDKANRAPAEDAQWFRLASQDVENSTGPEDPFGQEGDSVGVVTRWCPPDAFEGITVDHLRRVQAAVSAGEFKAHHSASDWVGNAVADALGLDVKNDRGRILKLLGTWEANDALRVEERRDQNRQMKKFMVVGKPADQVSATPAIGVASHTVAVSQESATLHPAPFRGAGVAGAARDAGQVSHFTAGNPALGPLDRTPRDSNQWEPKANGMILAPGETGEDVIPGWDN
ncbi:AAA family ATPase [Sphingomonas sp. J315]|uniref:AAA family ATPase n=1 Tax=Sphingomonas sp. J315 TaxID=2898433 RepID=UPI0021ADD2BB|nr:helicase RepA family protein [Sphingomonas sp. J315]UUX99441.1 helicase RepA family protein [Sphingomonas sp. J315]